MLPLFSFAHLQSWKTLQQAEVAIPAMNGICTSVAESWPQWQDWRADAAAHRAPLPSGWEEKLNRFQKMVIVRALAEASCTVISSVAKCDFYLPRERNTPTMMYCSRNVPGGSSA